MNIGVWLCGILVFPFAIVGILFAIFKEKAARFVSGFHTLSTKEQKACDKARLCRDVRNQCFTWSGIILVGALLSYWVSPYLAIAAFAAWLVLLFKDVHLDSHKAFEKYLSGKI